MGEEGEFNFGDILVSFIPWLGKTYANYAMNERNNQANMELAKYNADRTLEINKELYGLQNEYNIDMWNRKNDYNTPSAQMQRFADAGLNPNLVYGNGSNGNAGDIQTASLSPYNIDLATQRAYQISDPLDDLVRYIGLTQNIRMNDAQINRMDAETAGIKLQNEIRTTEGSIKRKDLEWMDEFKQANLTAIQNTIDREWQQFKNLHIQEDILDLERQLKRNEVDVSNRFSKMKEYGLNPNNEKHQLIWTLAVMAQNLGWAPVLDWMKNAMTP